MGKRYVFYVCLCSFVFGCLNLSGAIASTPSIGNTPVQGPAQVRVEGFADPLLHIRNTEQFEDNTDTLKLAIEDIIFHCHEGQCNQYYDRCDLHIHYRARLQKGMNLPVATAITCNGSIEYQTAGGDLLMNESEPVTIHRTLITEPHDMAHVDLHFAFSYYEGVVEAQLTSVKCRIHREELYSSVTTKQE